MEFIDDDVVEVLRPEPLQVLGLGQRLHRGAQDIDVGITAAPRVVANALAGQDADEGRRSLGEDLLPMRDEQNASGTDGCDIEGR